MKPYLTDKTYLTDKGERITLIEYEKVVSNEKELVKIFNEYFSNIAPNLDIQRPQSISLHHNPVLHARKNLKSSKHTRNKKKKTPSDVAFPFHSEKSL